MMNWDLKGGGECFIEQSNPIPWFVH